MLASSSVIANNAIENENFCKDSVTLIDFNNDIDNLIIEVNEESINEFLTRCKLTYNFVNGDGETVFTATYSVTLSSGSCQAAATLMRADAIDAYNEYMG